MPHIISLNFKLFILRTEINKCITSKPKIGINPFNIGAVNGNDVATALAKAKQYGWDSMQKGIEGGII